MSGAMSLEQVLARSLRAPKRRPGGFGLARAADGPVPPATANVAEESGALGSSTVEGAETPLQPPATTTVPLQGTKLAKGFSKQDFPKPPQLSLFKTKRNVVVPIGGGSSTNKLAQHLFGADQHTPHHHEHQQAGWFSPNVSCNLQDKTAVLRSAKRLGDWQTALAVLASLPPPEVPQVKSAEGNTNEEDSSSSSLSDTQLAVIVDTCLHTGRTEELKASALARLRQEDDHRTANLDAFRVAEEQARERAAAAAAERRKQQEVDHQEEKHGDHSSSVSTISAKKRGHAHHSHHNSTHPTGERLLNLMLDHLGKRGETPAVLDLVTKLSPERRTVSVLNGALQSFETDGQWDKALQWFHNHYHAVPLGTENGDEVEAITGLSTQASQSSSSTSSSNAKPNVVTFATLMAILETAGRVKESQELLHYFVPVEDRSAIMSSYAALIVVWSQRHGTRGVKKF